jgi:hypothetical protein
MKPRSFVRMFMPQFAPLVESGVKPHTVRKTPKRMPQPGDLISLRTWTGKPYRSKQRVLRESVITKVEPVTFLRLHRVAFGDGILNCEDELAFAKADGFESPAAMFKWFEDTHGLPFSGIVIHWDVGVDGYAIKPPGGFDADFTVACTFAPTPVAAWHRFCFPCLKESAYREEGFEAIRVRFPISL